MNRIINVAINYCSLSKLKEKHCAILFAGGKIYQISYNNLGDHAETLLLKRLIYTNKKYKLLVVRYSNGKFYNSKPCKHCLIEIQKYICIKKVLYSSGFQNEIINEKAYMIENEHISKGTRYFGTLC